MNEIEKRDMAGYVFIRNEIIHSGVTPSLREIGRAIGYESPRSVQLMLIRLEKRGLLSCVNGVIKLSPKKVPEPGERTVDVPLVGSVACGIPSLAEQEPEVIIQISTKLAKPGHRYFLLRATGTSMNKSCINDGDLVLVRQCNIANEGDMVVALINDEVTIKHFHRDGDIIILRPNSTDSIHRPIIVTEELIIQGVVVKAFPADLY